MCAPVGVIVGPITKENEVVDVKYCQKLATLFVHLGTKALSRRNISRQNSAIGTRADAFLTNDRLNNEARKCWGPNESITAATTRPRAVYRQMLPWN